MARQSCLLDGGQSPSSWTDHRAADVAGTLRTDSAGEPTAMTLNPKQCASIPLIRLEKRHDQKVHQVDRARPDRKA